MPHVATGLSEWPGKFRWNRLSTNRNLGSRSVWPSPDVNQLNPANLKNWEQENKCYLLPAPGFLRLSVMQKNLTDNWSKD